MLRRDEEQKLAQLEARLGQREDRLSGLAGDSPQPELAQRVYRLEERFDRLVAHLTGTLGVSAEPANQQE